MLKTPSILKNLLLHFKSIFLNFVNCKNKWIPYFMNLKQLRFSGWKLSRHRQNSKLAMFWQFLASSPHFLRLILLNKVSIPFSTGVCIIYVKLIRKNIHVYKNLFLYFHVRITCEVGNYKPSLPLNLSRNHLQKQNRRKIHNTKVYKLWKEQNFEWYLSSTEQHSISTS